MFKFGVGTTFQASKETLQKFPDSLLATLAKDTSGEHVFFDQWSVNTVQAIINMYEGRDIEVEDWDAMLRACDFFQIPVSAYPMGLLHAKEEIDKETTRYAEAQHFVDNIQAKHVKSCVYYVPLAKEGMAIAYVDLDDNSDNSDNDNVCLERVVARRNKKSGDTVVKLDPELVKVAARKRMLDVCVLHSEILSCDMYAFRLPDEAQCAVKKRRHEL